MSSTTDRPSGAAAAQAQPPHPPASAVRDVLTAVRNWATVMAYLMVQHLGDRSKAGRAAILFMIAEPLILIVLFYVIRGLVRGMVANYGESLFLFLASGLLPFYLFLRTSTLTRRGQSQPGQRLPRINSLDVFMATAAANALIFLLVIAGVFTGMWLYGIEQARPASISDCATALLLLVLVGGGVGLIHSAIARFFPVWLIIAGYSTRGLLFFSGVIHIADFYYPSVRAWLVWNPVLHGVEWFRLGVYGRYPILTLDQFYLVKCALVLLFIGIIADRATLRYGGK